MQKIKLTIPLLVLLSCAIFARPASAAYIDPNTGGVLFQVLAAIFGVLSGIILIFSGRIKKLFYKLLRASKTSKEEQASQEEEKGL